MTPEQLPTEEQISALVDRFYARVRQDDEIGPIFEDAVQNWDAHLQLLKEFWSTVLLASAQYKGNPLLAHFNLPIEERFFDRWLNLFAETANEVMTPPQAALILHKARQIAGNMKRVLAYREPGAAAAQPASPFGALRPSSS